MKSYKITIMLFHESFNGYTHKDGEKIFNITARNVISAENKLKKIAKEYTKHRRWYDIISIIENKINEIQI